jgi:AcrR family transcriptional regulator
MGYKSKQPLAYMPTATKSSPEKTARGSARDRLLDAAAVVFARDGLAASTTREIARAAGVNEVTIFRLFQTKQNLLTAVLERVFAPPPAAKAEGNRGGRRVGESDRMKEPKVETDLSEIVREYAVSHAAGIQKNLALKRVLIGEIQHFQEHELKVIRGIFEPARQQLIGRLRAAQEAGLARKEVNPAIVADQINAIVFMGVLKHSLPLPREYSARDHIDACVETIVRAIETPKIVNGLAGHRSPLPAATSPEANRR